MIMFVRLMNNPRSPTESPLQLVRGKMSAPAIRLTALPDSVQNHISFSHRLFATHIYPKHQVNFRLN